MSAPTIAPTTMTSTATGASGLLTMLQTTPTTANVTACPTSHGTRALASACSSAVAGPSGASASALLSPSACGPSSPNPATKAITSTTMAVQTQPSLKEYVTERSSESLTSQDPSSSRSPTTGANRIPQT
jgi:hypothetical protein